MIFLDIETVAQKDLSAFMPAREDVKYGNIKDEAKREKKYDEVCQSIKEKAALHAHMGKIALISYAINDSEILTLAGAEQDIIGEFNEVIFNLFSGDTGNLLIVGHNIKKFDLPFICRRTMIHGFHVHPVLKKELFAYHSPFIYDTMIEFGMGDRQFFISQEKMCRIFGVARQDCPVEGANFGSWWEKDRDMCIKHNVEDVREIREIFYKMNP